MKRPNRPSQQPKSNRLEQQIADLAARFRQAQASGDYATALAVTAKTLKIFPNHPQVLGDHALCLLRLGRYAEAKKAYLAARAQRPDDDNLLDGLAETCGALDETDEVRRFGLRSLEMKAAQVATEPATPLPSPEPLPFDPAARHANVIAFSLFGANPRYCETARLNVQAAARHLPHWVCRFYCDASVPTAVRVHLREAGAELVDVPDDISRDLSGVLWRFLVMDDPKVRRFLLRDADSLISSKEAAAVAEWLGSGRWFHAMRDFATHTELLLAGMWGGCGGALPPQLPVIRGYVAATDQPFGRYVDQHYLRRHVWPTVRQSLLTHDSVFGFMEGRPFPAHDEPGLGSYFHVGCNLAGGEIGAETSLADGQPLTWTLQDEDGRAICRYLTSARGGRWKASLPQPYLDQIKAGRWQVRVLEGSG